MDWKSISYDWNQVRAFLVSAEEGSFSAAARALGQTQPTLGRQVAALEEQLGLVLFERLGRSLAPTAAGLELLDHVRVMGDAANRLSLAASGQSQAIEGHVTITATDVYSIYVLPNALVRLREIAPGIDIDIVASNENRDLRRREADIAIRHGRPEHGDLIAKLIRETDIFLYASPVYLDRVGRPETIADLAGLDFVGYDQDNRLLDHLTALGLPLTRNNFNLASESGAVAWEMVRQGLGVGVMAAEIADRTEGIEPLFPNHPLMQIPIWLVTHRELHTSRRIRLVFDVLTERLSRS